MTTSDDVSTYPVPAPALVPLERLAPADWNPRLIRDVRFANLCRSIATDPSFLWNRPVLAQGNGTIYAGNMRYKAVEWLWLNGTPQNAAKETDIDWYAAAAAAGLRSGMIPAVIEDVPDEIAKARAIRDNSGWGEWTDTELAELVFELAEMDVDVTLLGLDDKALEELQAGPDSPGGFRDLSDGVATNITCPKCSYSWSQSK